ncbi:MULTISPECIES: type I polyketide synthase [unclassified Pseudomonas]|uniref:type I polyketide synthase n=1 Tax=unclassified Pseudomonas TaxID=196821 RepID=UPI000B88D5B3|nr:MULTISPECIES: type I polyketide synthase [unclassified Pseudomonas]PMV23869.1 polyketide synthase [Pseudomonas sp. FW305-3-2-15-C-TSA2]PMV30536.1 polyketide synthase [Pseudomonas sp. DP16D-L5]PMV40742.1 polyketide synthase [Pseudomonas sp. FW305-3-2-15-A-LB2]PMV47602.1 polyketide synthase [Pseudomonas sp. FW305-3-2-15-C-R2A1]PMV53022.1 polyketide synthase [Pseudomonas sp. FW305-3-2-15-C-LB1]
MDDSGQSVLGHAGPEILKQSLIKINQLKKELAAMKAQASEPIAIIGMSCRFPGGSLTPEQLWNNLCEGKSAIAPMVNKRWDSLLWNSAVPGESGKNYQKTAGLIDHIYNFDANFFGMSELEVRRTDPQQRLLLQLSWEAIEDTGLDYRILAGSKTGVYVGLSSDDYADFYTRSGDTGKISPLSALGCGKSIAPGRISYFFGFRGPALQLDTSCSSALVAADLACSALRNHEINMAVVGGANLILTPGASVAFSTMQALSPSGECRPFDEGADGYVRGEGAGVIVLKRLSDAIKEGLPVHAVISASAINHDGKSNGMTAPNGLAQQEVIAEALRKAQLAPEAVRYVECHGTATPLGDPIELMALSKFYGRTHRTWLGAVKSNIGHLEAAAGLAGLIKAALAVKHGRIPASLNCEVPNKKFAWTQSHLAVATTTQDWPDCAPVRHAAVSSFGMSGTNAHVVVSSHDQSVTVASSTLPQCLTLSAKDSASLLTQLKQLEKHLDGLAEDRLAALCARSNRCRTHLPVKFSAPASDKIMLLDKVREVIAQSVVPTAGLMAKTCFVFSGQGAQYKQMASNLYASTPVFRQALDRVSQFYCQTFDFDLLKVLFSPESDFQVEEVQPALFSVQYALTALWKAWGITPTVVIGHSVGEYAAACASGVMTMECAARLVWYRGRLIQAHTRPGGMYVVSTSSSCAEALLDEIPHSIAVENTPDTCVISVDDVNAAALEQTLGLHSTHYKRLHVARGFHSYLMEPVLDLFASYLDSVELKTPVTEFVSTVTGTAEAALLTTSGYWLRNVRDTVKFSSAVSQVMEGGPTLFIEIGPSSQLTSIINALDHQNEHIACASLDRATPDLQQLSKVLSYLYQHGRILNWPAIVPTVTCEPDVLPHYQFAQTEYFPEKALKRQLSVGEFENVLKAVSLT